MLVYWGAALKMEGILSNSHQAWINQLLYSHHLSLQRRGHHDYIFFSLKHQDRCRKKSKTIAIIQFLSKYHSSLLQHFQILWEKNKPKQTFIICFLIEYPGICLIWQLLVLNWFNVAHKKMYNSFIFAKHQGFYSRQK